MDNEENFPLVTWQWFGTYFYPLTQMPCIFFLYSIIVKVPKQTNWRRMYSCGGPQCKVYTKDKKVESDLYVPHYARFLKNLFCVASIFCVCKMNIVVFQRHPNYSLLIPWKHVEVYIYFLSERFWVINSIYSWAY
jgi:hypothetical protein